LKKLFRGSNFVQKFSPAHKKRRHCYNKQIFDADPSATEADGDELSTTADITAMLDNLEMDLEGIVLKFSSKILIFDPSFMFVKKIYLDFC